MSKVSGIFLYYCAIIAIFITASGFLASKTVEGYAFQLIFLPITLYFVFAVIKNLKSLVKPGQGPTLEVTLSSKKTTLIVFFIIFLALLAIGVKNIFFRKDTNIEQNSPPIATQNAQSSDKENALVFKAETTNEASLQTLSVVADSPASLVNIRGEPTTSAQIIGRAKNGQEFTYIKLANEWYEIVLDNNQKGYIHKNYVKEAEK